MLMAGNARSHAHWRYACDHLKLLSVIPACNNCIISMRKSESDSFLGHREWMNNGYT